MNKRYNYGNRNSGGSTDAIGMFAILTIFFGVVLGVLYMNLRSDVRGLYEDVESLRQDAEKNQKTIDSLIAIEPAIEIPKKEEPVKIFKRKAEKDTSRHSPEKPKEITQPIIIQDTTR